jgi:hypothetical protein
MGQKGVIETRNIFLMSQNWVMQKNSHLYKLVLFKLC